MSATLSAGETITFGNDDETVTVDVANHDEKEYKLTLEMDSDPVAFAVENGVATPVEDELAPEWTHAVLHRLGVRVEVADGS